MDENTQAGTQEIEVDPLDQMIQEDLAEMEGEEEAAPSEEVESQEAEAEEETEEEAEEEPDKEEPEADEEEEAEEPKKRKGKKTAQDRINELVRERNEERRQREELERQINAKQQEPEDLSPLDPDNFESYDDFLKAEAERLSKVKLQELTKQQEQQAEEQRRLKLAQDFQKKIDAAGIPDYAEKLQSLKEVPTLSNEVIEAIQVDPVGPQIAYYLAEHLDVAEEVATSSPFQAAKIIGQLSVKLQSPKQVPKKQTRAPDPIKPVKGKTPSKIDNLDKMPLEDFLKLDD
jgi:hypothetical protein